MRLTELNSSLKRVRTSVTVPAQDYQELERLARQKKVSVAWIIRDAVELYLAERQPLFDTRANKPPVGQES